MTLLLRLVPLLAGLAQSIVLRLVLSASGFAVFLYALYCGWTGDYARGAYCLLLAGIISPSGRDT